MNRLHDDLVSLRTLMADPDSVVLNRIRVFEDADGRALYPDETAAGIPEGTTRGCVLGNIARVAGDFTVRYEDARDAVAEAVGAFTAKDDDRCLAIIDAAIEKAA